MTTNSGALLGWFKRHLSRPDEPDSDPTSVSTTRHGGDDDQEPVVVWEAANRMEAEIVAGRLHSEGIPAIIRGEALGAIYGLTTGSLAAATVLVPAPLAEKALMILATDVDWEDAEHPAEHTQEDPSAGASGHNQSPDDPNGGYADGHTGTSTNPADHRP